MFWKRRRGHERDNWKFSVPRRMWRWRITFTAFCIILWRDWGKPGSGRGLSGGRDYQAGVILGFQERLRANQEVHREEGLVWVGDPDLETFVRNTYPRLQSMRSAGVGRNEALAAGKEQENLDFEQANCPKILE